MFYASTLPEHLGFLDASVIALLGYVVVFFGLILLMAVVILLGKFFARKSAAACACTCRPGCCRRARAHRSRLCR